MDYAYQGQLPPNKLAAMVASNQFPGEQNWYTDTGATDHITSDVGNLSLRSGYHGSDKVSVGNGASIFLILGPILLSHPMLIFSLMTCYVYLISLPILFSCISSNKVSLTLLVFVLRTKLRGRRFGG